MTEHTDACLAARAGHSYKVYDAKGRVIGLTNQPDPYPLMQDLGPLEREAILSCPHRDHDVVRIFCR